MIMSQVNLISQKDTAKINYHSRTHCRWNSCLQLVIWTKYSNWLSRTETIRLGITSNHNICNTVEGSLSQKSSRHILQASPQASWIPPSTKAAADVKCASDFLASSIVGDCTRTHNVAQFIHSTSKYIKKRTRSNVSNINKEMRNSAFKCNLETQHTFSVT